MKCQVEMSDLDELNDIILKTSSDQLVIIIDQNIWQLYREQFKKLCEAADKEVILWKATNGEKVKNIENYESCIEFILSKGIHRNAHLVAIGGGATSDFAGFIAATVLRGISWSVVPTSLLAMIDAGIGGKVGINSVVGKNLIGAFHMPKCVWVVPSFLKTLPALELISGKGELVKYCFLDKKINEKLSLEGFSDSLIYACAKYKTKIVDADFKESGKRKLLNLGHTFGHAIEKKYSISHGEAVYWGMVFLFILFEQNENLELMSSLNLKLKLGYSKPPWYQKTLSTEDLMDYVKKDKKKTDSHTIDLICVERVGEVEIKPFKIIELVNLIEGKKDAYKSFQL